MALSEWCSTLDSMRTVIESIEHVEFFHMSFNWFQVNIKIDVFTSRITCDTYPTQFIGSCIYYYVFIMFGVFRFKFDVMT